MILIIINQKQLCLQLNCPCSDVPLIALDAYHDGNVVIQEVWKFAASVNICTQWMRWWAPRSISYLPSPRNIPRWLLYIVLLSSSNFVHTIVPQRHTATSATVTNNFLLGFISVPPHLRRRSHRRERMIIVGTRAPRTSLHDRPLWWLIATQRGRDTVDDERGHIN